MRQLKSKGIAPNTTVHVSQLPAIQMGLGDYLTHFEILVLFSQGQLSYKKE